VTVSSADEKRNTLEPQFQLNIFIFKKQYIFPQKKHVIRNHAGEKEQVGQAAAQALFNDSNGDTPSPPYPLNSSTAKDQTN